MASLIKMIRKTLRKHHRWSDREEIESFAFQSTLVVREDRYFICCITYVEVQFNTIPCDRAHERNGAPIVSEIIVCQPSMPKPRNDSGSLICVRFKSVVCASYFNHKNNTAKGDATWESKAMMPLPLSTALEFVPRISTCSNCCFIALHCFGNVVFITFL